MSGKLHPTRLQWQRVWLLDHHLPPILALGLLQGVKPKASDLSCALAGCVSSQWTGECCSSSPCHLILTTCNHKSHCWWDSKPFSASSWTAVLLRWLSGEESACQGKRCWRQAFIPQVRKIPWSRKRQPLLLFLSGKFHGWRSPVGYSPWELQRVRQNWACKCSWTIKKRGLKVLIGCFPC